MNDMISAATKPRQSGEKNAATPEVLDKLVFQRMYYLKALYDLTAELSPITSSRKLLESFLLMAMGVNGSGQGMMMICDRQGRSVLSASRGTRFDPEWTVESAEKHLYRGFQAAENRRLAAMSVTFIGDPQQVFSELETGLDVHSALLFMVDDSLLGIVGLGAPIDGRNFTLEEKDMLSGMTASFMVFLKNVRAYETVQALNADLLQTNDALRRTIADLTEARQQIRLLELAGIRLKQLFQQKIEQVGRFRAVDALLVLVVASLLSLFFNFSNPNGIPLLPEEVFREPGPRVDARAVQQLLATGDAVLVDARPSELFNLGHIPDAISIPAPLFDIIYPMKLAPRLQAGQAVVVYGRTFSKHYDDEVAYRLLQRHDDVRVMTGGMAAWKKQEMVP
ncbi:MAG: rhodanese-like domain-containing protein [Deltaproteobacteria bacterium]|nr:rhodanese-like domain-containing protein [Deltaproteobacteria bacterium]